MHTQWNKGCRFKDKLDDLRRIAIAKVREAMVLTIDARKVGEVYLKLAKYMFRVNPTLQSFKGYLVLFSFVAWELYTMILPQKRDNKNLQK